MGREVTGNKYVDNSTIAPKGRKMGGRWQGKCSEEVYLGWEM